jgi:hypothetical protein
MLRRVRVEYFLKGEFRGANLYTSPMLSPFNYHSEGSSATS